MQLTDFFLIGAAVIAFAVIITAVTSSTGQLQKDSQRLFTAEQRRLGMQRASNQCEWGTFKRCTRYAFHGDHWFPWSRGGATSMRNYVSLCERCNTSKGAKMPSRLQTHIIYLRRGQYFDPRIDRTLGEWARGGR